MPAIVKTGSTLAAGIRDDFDLTYQPSYDGVLELLGDVMQLDVPFNHRTETFGMHETMPYPEFFNEGSEAIPSEGTGDKSFSVTAYSYGKRVNWKRIDRLDNKVGDLAAKAAMLGQHFASLDSRVFFELVTNSATLLPAIPNAPDGAALFSATDGASADRFGRSGGNIVTGTGVTAATIKADWFSTLQAFDNFQDTKGQPYYEPNGGTATYTIYMGSALRGAAVEAFKAELVQGSSAAPSNVILASGETLNFRFTSRITDNDWYVFRNDAPVKAVFSGVREPLHSADATEDNSDEARTSGVEYVQWAVRKAYGVNVPFAAIKVNN